MTGPPTAHLQHTPLSQTQAHIHARTHAYTTEQLVILMIMEPYTLYKCDPVSDCDQKDRDKKKAAFFSRNILSSKFRVSNTHTHTQLLLSLHALHLLSNSTLF